MESHPSKLDPSVAGCNVGGIKKERLALWGSQLTLLESVIVTKQGASAMGTVGGELGLSNGKMVKSFTYSNQDRILFLSTTTKEYVERSDKNIAYFAFAIGSIMVLAGGAMLHPAIIP